MFHGISESLESSYIYAADEEGRAVFEKVDPMEEFFENVHIRSKK